MYVDPATPDPVHRVGPYRVDLGARVIDGPAGRLPLRPLEARFLAYLFTRRGRVVYSRELLTEVWGYHPSVASKAPALLVSRLRARLGDPAELVRTVPGGGYSVEPPGEPLVLQATRLAERAGREGEALARLGALQPELEAALESAPLPERARLLVARATWATASRLHLDATPLWAAAHALGGTLGAECALWATRLSMAGGSAAAAQDALAPWAGGLGPEPEAQRVRGEILLTLVNLDVRLGEHERARSRAAELLGVGDALGAPRLRGLGTTALATLGVAWRGGDTALAEARFRDGVGILRRAGEHVAAAEQEANLAATWYAAGRLDDAEAAFTRAAHELEGAGRPLDAWHCRVSLGTVWLARGEVARALSVARDAVSAFEAAVDLPGEATARLLQGRAALLEALPEARQALARSEELAGRCGLSRVRSHAARYLGAGALLAGDATAATAAFARAAHPTEPGPAAFLARWRALADGSTADPSGLGAEDTTPGPSWIDRAVTRLLEHM